jgi:hypothetical protein
MRIEIKSTILNLLNSKVIIDHKLLILKFHLIIMDHLNHKIKGNNHHIKEMEILLMILVTCKMNQVKVIMKTMNKA